MPTLGAKADCPASRLRKWYRPEADQLGNAGLKVECLMGQVAASVGNPRKGEWAGLCARRGCSGLRPSRHPGLRSVATLHVRDASCSEGCGAPRRASAGRGARRSTSRCQGSSSSLSFWPQPSGSGSEPGNLPKVRTATLDPGYLPNTIFWIFLEALVTLPR